MVVRLLPALFVVTSMSNQQNIVHASDSVENAAIELRRFFRPEEIFDYQSGAFTYVYGDGECK